ncbi:unnamed protein product [Orchesella dallaii]|uniref:Metalloendopeptidase n=1 Tax=Orchesella dallaii TaxID=48710 RepID=A0ABP1RYQ0_9HEXA
MTVKYYFLLKKLSIFVTITNFSLLVTCFTCDTPDSWLSGSRQIEQGSDESDSDFQHVRITGEKWPDGVVKYKFNKTLKLVDINDIYNAFDEYHKKTCIRFEPAEEDDIDFLSIEVDNEVCGKANVCKLGNGSYQFARFGGICRNMSTMVHELGHTLCLGHEHQRRDRDKYISYADCDDKGNIPKKRRPQFYNANGIYDYASQMHYECDSCELGGWPTSPGFCGVQLTPGLSTLDADAINALYDCQGCKRHRWRPAEFLTDDEKRNVQSFHISGSSSIFPCRGSARGEVSPGRFDMEKKSCFIRFGTELLEIKENVEVLTIPGGLDAQCSIYKLVDRKEALAEVAVPAGTSFRSYNFTMYIAYGYDGVTDENTIGKVGYSSDDKGFTRPAELAVSVGNSSSGSTLDYKVLTCSLDSSCVIAQWFVERKGCS